MERIANCRYRLSSGREFRTHYDLVALVLMEDPGCFRVTEGPSGRSLIAHGDSGYAPGTDWTAAERLELAEHMIQLWTAFRDAQARPCPR